MHSVEMSAAKKAAGRSKTDPSERMTALEEEVLSLQAKFGVMSGLVDGVVCPKLEATEESVNALRGDVAALRRTFEELRAMVEDLMLREKDAETHTGGGVIVPFLPADDESGVARETIAGDPEEHGLTPAAKLRRSLPDGLVVKVVDGALAVEMIVNLLEGIRHFKEVMRQYPAKVDKHIQPEAQELLRQSARAWGQATSGGEMGPADWEDLLVMYVKHAGNDVEVALKSVKGFCNISDGAKITLPLVEAAVYTLLCRFEAAIRSTNAVSRSDPSTRGLVVTYIIRALPQPLGDAVRHKMEITGVYGVKNSITFKSFCDTVRECVKTVWEDSSTHAAFNVSAKEAKEKTRAKRGDKGDEGDKKTPFIKSKGVGEGCTICGKTNHTTDACWKNPARAGRTPPPVFASAGTGAGAGASVGPSATKTVGTTSKPVAAAAGAGGACHNCGGSGHRLAQCTEPCRWFKEKGVCSKKDCHLPHK